MHIMNPTHLNVYVVDDDEAVRRSVVTWLFMRGHRVQAFASGESFLAGAELDKGGCVILDRLMDGMSGLDVFHQLRQRRSPLVVLFLSGHGDIPAAWDAAQNGAFLWLPKPCDENLLLDAIDGALAKAAEVTVLHRARRAACVLWDTLTTREGEVARLVATGLQNREIGRELGIDVRTVEHHRARVFAKLGLNNASALDRFIRDNEL